MFSNGILKTTLLTVLVIVTISLDLSFGRSLAETSGFRGSQTSGERSNVILARAINKTAQNYVIIDDMYIPKKHKNNVTNHIQNVISNPYYRWPGAVVPFQVDDSLSNSYNLIYNAMNEYFQKTCIFFRPKNDDDKSYVFIFSGDGCNSQVGMQNSQPQLLSLGSGCLRYGTVVHELGHSIGLFHEQNRSDRDDYVRINLNNVIEKQRSNFDKLSPNDNILYTQYDFESIMQYGEYAFSKFDGVLKTIVAKNGYRLKEPYDKAGLTNSDVYKIKRAYGCS